MAHELRNDAANRFQSPTTVTTCSVLTGEISSSYTIAASHSCPLLFRLYIVLESSRRSSVRLGVVSEGGKLTFILTIIVLVSLESATFSLVNPVGITYQLENYSALFAAANFDVKEDP